MKKLVLLSGVILTASAAYFALTQPKAVAQSSDAATPVLSDLAKAGKLAFDETCAACHGVDLQGTETGPAFLHRFYVAGHHSDMSFVMAIKQGARQHHCPFGDMPAQPHVTDQQIGEIIKYVREIQAANGF